MHVYIVECIAVYYIKIYTDTTRLFYVGSRGGGYPVKPYTALRLYTLSSVLLYRSEQCYAVARAVYYLARAGVVRSRRRDRFCHTETHAAEVIAGLPGAAGFAGFAGLLPGCCRVAARLGCRVAGARAQIGNGGARGWTSKALSTALPTSRKPFDAHQGPIRGPARAAPPYVRFITMTIPHGL